MSVASLNVLMVDPSLFTPPYDASLGKALARRNAVVRWAARPLRPGETPELELSSVDEIYYPGERTSARRRGFIGMVCKAFSHVASSIRLVRLVNRQRPDIVHFQWALIPIVDFLVFRIISRTVPVVFTVHDTTPFNGSATARLQAFGFPRLLKAADFLIVHTNSGKKDLIRTTGTPDRVVRIHHGPLHLAIGASDRADERVSDSRWTFLLFGKLQTYKGVDVLVEALGVLGESERERIRVIVAGEPIMAFQPILDRADALGVRGMIEFRLFRHTEPEMHALFESCDALVFPYRNIEASGVLFLALPYGKWIIASRLGAFAECIEEGLSGSLVEPGSPEELAEVMIRTIGSTPRERPQVPTWDAIAADTLRIYEMLIAGRKSAAERKHAGDGGADDATHRQRQAES